MAISLEKTVEAPPIIRPAGPQRSWWWLLAAIPLLAGAFVLFQFNPAQNGFYPRCVLYSTTGIYCPGCGSLRALHHLSHGQLLTAMRYNLLLILSLPFAAYYTWRYLISWAKGQPLPALPLLNGRWLKLLVGLVILFTILRNIPYEPFIWLAPPGGN